MIEPILIIVYILSFYIYAKNLLSDLRSFKPSNFLEYVIVSLIAFGSIVPILNSIYAYKSYNYKQLNK